MDSNLGDETLESIISYFNNMAENEFDFVPEDVGLPPAYFSDSDFTEDDICLHEYIEAKIITNSASEIFAGGLHVEGGLPLFEDFAVRFLQLHMTEGWHFYTPEYMEYEGPGFVAPTDEERAEFLRTIVPAHVHLPKL